MSQPSLLVTLLSTYARAESEATNLFEAIAAALIELVCEPACEPPAGERGRGGAGGGRQAGRGGADRQTLKLEEGGKEEGGKEAGAASEAKVDEEVVQTRGRALTEVSESVSYGESSQ